jgi:hypothetical protein
MDDALPNGLQISMSIKTLQVIDLYDVLPPKRLFSLNIIEETTRFTLDFICGKIRTQTSMDQIMPMEYVSEPLKKKYLMWRHAMHTCL